MKRAAWAVTSAATAIVMFAACEKERPTQRAILSASIDSVVKFAQSSNECRTTPVAKVSDDFIAAQASDPLEPRLFCVHVGNLLYATNSNGDGVVLTGPQEMQPLRLRFDTTEFQVEGILANVRKSVLYLLYQVTDGESATGYLDAFSEKTFTPMWSSPAAVAMNLGEPLLTDSAAYVTGFDMFGKIRISDGRYFWKQSFIDDGSLTLHQYFVRFDKPSLRDGTVILAEIRNGALSGKTVVMNDSTGSIISPAVLSAHSPCRLADSSCEAKH